MTKVKSPLGIILSLLLILTSLPLTLTVLAETSDDGYLTYTVTDDEAAITGYVSIPEGGELVIPEKLGGYPVTAIGEEAFYYCSALERVVILDSVTSIGRYAFRSCASLVTVIIPDSVTEIGENAFYDCISLKDLTISDSLTKIESFTFSNRTSLESVVIPNSVTIIDSYAFSYDTSFKSITIYDNVISIGTSTFRNIDADAFIYGHEDTAAEEYATANSITFVALCRHTDTEIVGYIAATCTEDGYTGDEVCIICGETVEYGEVIAALGHTDDDEDGVCDVCGLSNH
ncbi:MAG: leucine-rich repeat domain-containing protein [Clostridiales bacterium]|nr:leucine-rich repeat domain-containing protein [Clostridiales bacterium]